MRDAAKASDMMSSVDRSAFLLAWIKTGCEDLYDGELHVYFEIIAQELERRQIKLDDLKKKVDEMALIFRRS